MSLEKKYNTAVFCVGSIGEAVSACTVLRLSTAKKNILIFYLGDSGEKERVKKEVIEFTNLFSWSAVVFLGDILTGECGLAYGGGLKRLKYNVKAQMYNRCVLREFVVENIGKEIVENRGTGVAVFFTISYHVYVQHIMGLMSKADRVWFPHSLDAPRQRQIELSPETFEQRGPAARKTASRSLTFNALIKALVIKYVFRLIGGGKHPVPFDGVDYVLCFSENETSAPFQRIDPKMLQDALARIAGIPSLVKHVKGAFGDIRAEDTCVVCLSEHGEDRVGAIKGGKREEAISHLMDLVSAREEINTFLIKPHPRSRYSDYLDFVGRLEAVVEKHKILKWPDSMSVVLIEVLLIIMKFRCTASIASSAAPPWACPDNVSYVSSSSGRILMEGWDRKEEYFNYDIGAKEREREGLSIDLG